MSCSPSNTDYNALGNSATHAYFSGEAYRELVSRFVVEVRASVAGYAPALSKWMGLRTRVGGGTYGSAFMASVGDQKDAVVIKMNNNVEASKDLEVEFGIQQYLNLLREVCPNFVLGLSIFQCPMLIIDDQTKQAKSELCKVNDYAPLVNFIVLEKVTVSPSVTRTLNEFIYELYTNNTEVRLYPMKREIVLSLIIQLAYALDIAQERYQFVHQDLHTSNILIESLYPLRTELRDPGLRKVNIDYGHGHGKVATGFIPVMIDFGFTRMSVPKPVVQAFQKAEMEAAVTPDYAAVYGKLAQTVEGFYQRYVDQEIPGARFNFVAVDYRRYDYRSGHTSKYNRAYDIYMVVAGIMDILQFVETKLLEKKALDATTDAKTIGGSCALPSESTIRCAAASPCRSSRVRNSTA